MIVTRTRLCTRLVILLGYTPRHLLFVTVVLLVLYLYSYSCYRYSVAYIIMLFDYLISAVILVIALCTLFICTSFSLYTHSLGRFLTTLDLHVQILDACSIVQVFDEMVRFARSWTLCLLILVFFPFFIPAIIL